MAHIIRQRMTARLDGDPAWRAFNRNVRSNGDVGIWHETYVVRPGSYETIYNNMPPYGLGRVGRLVPATGNLELAGARRSHVP